MIQLLDLYPRPWRDRYGDEFAELLATRPPGARDRFDIVLGAIDARLNPQVASDTSLDRVRLGEPRLRALGVLGGAFLTAWIALALPWAQPWNSIDAGGPPAFALVSFLSGWAGAIVLSITLLAIALRYDHQIGPSGAIGAVLTVGGLVFAAMGGGVPALVMLGLGSALFCWRAAGRVVSRPVALVLAGATALTIVSFLAFGAGNGQDVSLLRLLLPYGPAWMVFGLSLREPAPRPLAFDAPSTLPISA